MKRGILVLLLVTLLMLMSACNITERPSDISDAEQTETSKNTELSDDLDALSNTDASKNKEIAISEIYSEDGSTSSSDGTGYDYTYHVPQIEDDTPDAAYINEEIKAMYGSMVELDMESVNSKDIPAYTCVTYESYRNDTVLSLLMKTVSFYGQFEEYDVYNYDVEKGVCLSNDELLAMQNVTEEQYLFAVRRAAVQLFDSIYFPVDEESMYDSSIYLGEIYERRSWTLLSENINLGVPTYLDNDGKLNAVVQVGSLINSKWFNYLLPLEIQNTPASLSATYSDFLTVDYKNNELTVTFKDTERLHELLTDYNVESTPTFNKAIPIHGCYSKYTDIFVIDESGTTFPRVYLITEEGRVEYIQTEYCISANYYCTTGPLPDLGVVTSLEDGMAPTGDEAIFAILENGERVALNMYFMMVSNCMSDRFKGSWSSYVTFETDGGGNYETFFALDMNDWYDVVLSSSILDGEFMTQYSGSLSYLGMAENGVIYHYCLSDYETTSSGAFALSDTNVWGDENYIHSLSLKELSGGLIYMEPGNTIEFLDSVG